MRNRELNSWVEALVMISSVTALTDKELLGLALSTQAKAVYASDAIWAAPIGFSEPKV